MGEVIDLPVITSLDLDPARVLEAASKAGLTGVVIIGYDADSEEYFASSIADGGDIIWLLERMKMKLLVAADEIAR